MPLVLFNSCAYLIFPHKSFVSSPEDPLLIKKKHDIQTSISIKPFKFYEGNFNYGLTNHLALRFKAGGFVDLLNFNTSVLYFNNINKINFFFGPSFGYQSNQIKRRIGDGTFVREYQYSCLYYSPGLLLGLSLFRGNSVEHYFTIKSQYNIVDKYEYFYKEEDRYTGYQNESLKYNIPNFYNCEPTYTI
ncbi:MAG: hypothetical protein JNM96_08050, partial [Bacteroidia bacterium]|nr:hypothetical protein [Bacteroidia bacterium]